MSDIDLVVNRTRRIEGLLRSRFHADGRGLHQLISSSEERLPHDVVAKLRYIASVRNKILHEDGFELEDRKHFFQVCSQCEKELTPRSGRFIWGVAIALMSLLTFAAAAFYYLNWAEFSVHL
jgi:hypothetical protein